MAAGTTPRLTPKIRALVATDRLNRPPVGRLTAAHVDALLAVADDPASFGGDVSARHALTALAEGADATIAIPALDRALGDEEAPVADRVSAAVGLARIGDADARRTLVTRMRIRDPRVLRVIFKSLGQVGGPTELRELAKLPVPADTAARRQLRFAEALIAHRHGLEGPWLDAPPPDDDPGGPNTDRVAVALRLRSARRTDEARRRLAGSTWGIDLADRSYELTCGDAGFTLFPNADIGDSVTSAERVFERPLLAGLLARWYPAGIRAEAQLLLLTRPDDGGARLDIARTDGRVDYVGRLEPSGPGVTFRVTGVDRSNASRTLVEGAVTGRGVSLDVAFSAPRRGASETSAVES